MKKAVLMSQGKLKETSPSQSKTADQSGDQFIPNLMNVDLPENSRKVF
jgi:hypothetical protein